MDIVGIIVTLIIGAIAGWLAGVIVEGAGFGLLWNIIIGIVGAFITAALGAIVLLLIVNLLKSLF
jgi:uncharacterized membrane protein YeaQ/YmgE (transglycosylase-associated protein family)